MHFFRPLLAILASLAIAAAASLPVASSSTAWSSSTAAQTEIPVTFREKSETPEDKKESVKQRVRDYYWHVLAPTHPAGGTLSAKVFKHFPGGHTTVAYYHYPPDSFRNKKLAQVTIISSWDPNNPINPTVHAHLPPKLARNKIYNTEATVTEFQRELHPDDRAHDAHSVEAHADGYGVTAIKAEFKNAQGGSLGIHEIPITWSPKKAHQHAAQSH